MQADEVRRLLDKVKRYADRDNEAAHEAEDAMRDTVLRAIAEGATNAAELAAIALESNDIEYARWYA